MTLSKPGHVLVRGIPYNDQAISSNEDSDSVGEEGIAAEEDDTSEGADDHEFDLEESDGEKDVDGDFEEAGNGEPSCGDKRKWTAGQAQQLKLIR